ncbi:hypothetical protein LJB95_02850 [Paludibacteraceae bacterium OttesenSCG-928-F17]|nr:hypothetical protein [Paludibacteraceae bacterium OttesenSCG-928-F17]
MKQFGEFLLGLLIGLVLPLGFIWLYLYNFYPDGYSVIEAVKQLYPGALFGRLLILSIIPDLIAAFIFYKFDKFRFGAGIIAGLLPYLITSFFMFS